MSSYSLTARVVWTPRGKVVGEKEVIRLVNRKVVLIRHGRSSHVVKGLLDLDAFLKWREAYEAAGIGENEVPPRELVLEAQSAGAFVSSDVRRAIESARLLAAGRDVIASPLLRELSLVPLRLPGLRLPLMGWALTYGVKWLMRRHATPEEEQRVRIAAQWLIDLSARHGEVIVLTHASFRSLLAKEFARREWKPVTPRRRSAHWSAWSFSPNQ